MLKADICQPQEKIVEALKKWANADDSKWSVWISEHLYADLNLSVDSDTITDNSIQVFFIGENMSSFILTLYDFLKPSSRQMADKDIDSDAHDFSLEVSKQLNTELHKFCSVDFVILPCAMPYTKFINEPLVAGPDSTRMTSIEDEPKDSNSGDEHIPDKEGQRISATSGTDQMGRNALNAELKKQQNMVIWYYTGPDTLDPWGYRETRNAAIILTGASYVPHILAGVQKQENQKVSSCRGFSLSVSPVFSSDPYPLSPPTSIHIFLRVKSHADLYR